MQGKPTNPPAPPALAGAVLVGVAVSVRFSSEHSVRLRASSADGVQNSFRFVWVLRKMFTNTEHLGVLPTPVSLTRAPGGKSDQPPPGGTGLSHSGPGPASPTPNRLPLPGAAGIMVCSALSTSQGHPAWALPRVPQEAAAHVLSVPQGGSPSSWRQASWGSSCALSGRCLRCPGAPPRPGSSCGASGG